MCPSALVSRPVVKGRPGCSPGGVYGSVGREIPRTVDAAGGGQREVTPVTEPNPNAANTARKYRLYPTSEQAERLTGWAHTCRSIYNVALEQREIVYHQRGYTLRAVEQCQHLTQARGEIDWIRELPAQCGQQVLRNLDAAYDNWWNTHSRNEAPDWHKRGRGLSVPFPGQAVVVRKPSAKWGQVRIPKLGWIKFRMSRPLDRIVRNATVSKDGLGWHIAFGVHVERPAVAPNGLPSVGVDFGIACSAYCSDETKPREMDPSLTVGEKRRLLGLERRKARQVTFAKKHNGGLYSRRLRRTIASIADLKSRQARRRLDFTHKLTTDLAKNHGWVAIEDLRVKQMTKSSKGTVEKPGKNVRQKAGLNRSILDNTPYERKRQLAYKAPLFGSELRLVPAPYTSQMCSACGVIDGDNRAGCGRLFACTACGHTEHADLNAARNIEAKARVHNTAVAVGSTVQHASPQGVRGRKGARTRELTKVGV